MIKVEDVSTQEDVERRIPRRVLQISGPEVDIDQIRGALETESENNFIIEEFFRAFDAACQW